MRLSDEEIHKLAEITQTNDKFEWLIPALQTVAHAAMDLARDFYENQKCETCREDGICGIQACWEDMEVIENTVDFGCTKWEPKK